MTKDRNWEMSRSCLETLDPHSLPRFPMQGTFIKRSDMMAQIRKEVVAERRRIVRRLEEEADRLIKAGLESPQSKPEFLAAAWALKRQAGLLKEEIKDGKQV